VKKSIWIFLLLIILPSLILGWLALLSTDDQQVLVEKWTSELYQKEAESVATSVRALVEEQRREFNRTVREMIGTKDAGKLAATFAADLPKVWQRKAVGFVIKDGLIISPTAQQARNDKEWQEFLMGNSAFLSANVPATVYWMSGEELNRPDNILWNKRGGKQTALISQNVEQKPQDSQKPGAPLDTAISSNFSDQTDSSVYDDGKDDKIAVDTYASAVRPKQDNLAYRGNGETDGRILKLDADGAIPADKKELQFNWDAVVGKDQPLTIEAKNESAVNQPKSTVSEKTSAKESSGASDDAKIVSDETFTFHGAVVSGAVLNETRGSISDSKLSLPTENASPNARNNNAVGAYRLTPAPKQLPLDSPAPSVQPLVEGTLSAEMQSEGSVISTPNPVPVAKPVVKAKNSTQVFGGFEERSFANETSSVSGKGKKMSKSLPAPATPVAAPATTDIDDDKQTELYAYKTAISRSVTPQRQKVQAEAWSQLTSTTADFGALTEGNNEGLVSRYVQDKLEIIFWMRPSQAPEMIFGCRLYVSSLEDLWKDAVLSHVQSNYAESEGISLPSRSSGKKSTEYVLALLDDRARPVITQPSKEIGRDWKRPFVATEIGEILPHWEVALYLMKPDQLQLSAKNVRHTLIFLIVTALVAIAWGCWVVVTDTRRQLVLAQKKTDFVSNVSHELKTPLTSIRMFAELMQSGNPETAPKFPQYLRIIMVEAERLTRLINNVLDFAKIERKQKTLDRNPLDLHEVVSRVWEGQELHLQENGFVTHWEMAEPPYPVIGDEDALAQVLVNLISNAEKYSGNGSKEVELHTYMDGAYVCVSVLDRGLGVPSGEERKIFEAFYRAHDSLSSGIQGSGLGLTLAQRIVREQGGEIIYHPRKDGGSVFTLRMPLALPLD